MKKNSFKKINNDINFPSLNKNLKEIDLFIETMNNKFSGLHKFNQNDFCKDKEFDIISGGAFAFIIKKKTVEGLQIIKLDGSNFEGEVAVKELKEKFKLEELIKINEETEKIDNENLKFFIREIEILSKLVGKKNIVQLLGYQIIYLSEENRVKLLIILEFIKGCTLYDYLKVLKKKNFLKLI
jgi:serine/threonine protein kinase